MIYLLFLRNMECKECQAAKLEKRRKAQREAYARYIASEAGKRAKREASRKYHLKKKEGCAPIDAQFSDSQAEAPITQPLADITD